MSQVCWTNPKTRLLCDRAADFVYRRGHDCNEWGFSSWFSSTTTCNCWHCRPHRLPQMFAFRYLL